VTSPVLPISGLINDALYSTKSVSALLVIALLTSAACYGRDSYRTRDHRIALVTPPHADFSESVRAEMRRELDSILKPLSVEGEWQSLHEAQRNLFLGRLVVVRFRGSCRARTFVSSENVVARLGFTHVSEGEVLSFVEVNCDKVWHFIQGVALRQAGSGDHLLGKALGRVLGHEIYHVIAGTGRHGKGGVTKAEVSPVDLTTGLLMIDAASAERMLRQLRGGPSSAYGSSAPAGRF
jgi:hypothetical protein